MVCSNSCTILTMHAPHIFLLLLVLLLLRRYDCYIHQRSSALQDFLKQSSTRIFFISDKIATLALEMYRSPTRQPRDVCTTRVLNRGSTALNFGISAGDVGGEKTGMKSQ